MILYLSYSDTARIDEGCVYVCVQNTNLLLSGEKKNFHLPSYFCGWCLWIKQTKDRLTEELHLVLLFLCAHRSLSRENEDPEQ